MSDQPISDQKPQNPDDQAEHEQTANGLTVTHTLIPDELLILPLFDRPFFPAQGQTLMLDEKPWLPTVKAIGETDHHMVGLSLYLGDDPQHSDPAQMATIGTAVRMHPPSKENGQIQFVAEGVQRFEILEWLNTEGPYRARVRPLIEPEEASEDTVKAHAIAIINTIKEMIPLNPLYKEELKYFLERFDPNEPSALADFAASMTSADRLALQQVLETVPIIPRMEKTLALLKKELEVAKLQHKIRSQVEDKTNEQQRQFFLREQLKLIQQELGLAKDDRSADIERFEKRLQPLQLSDEAQKAVQEELDKLRILEPSSPEYGVARSYLDWVTALPWGVHSNDKLDLKTARERLDADHDGLEEVKDRIIEFLAVGKLRGGIGGSIILLLGPPGVGKTSIGRSVADAVGRKFYRFSVGGMRDEAEIKGHRRTYVGAMPGKFIQTLKHTQTANPVIMLDEIDKIGSSYQGDPASALLEVLDPEQNADFLDHYLDVRFDLSKALFICTANQLDSIPGPLLDRMEIIRLSGYIAEEKLAIAKHHLWPKQLKNNGLKAAQVRITDPTILAVIDGYAREAGVRGLDKQLGRLVRKAAVQIVTEQTEQVRINTKNLKQILGRPVFNREASLSGIGVITGLAWTAMGGSTLAIEATRVHTKQRGFKLTGQLGDVMQESAQIAYSYVNAQLQHYGIAADALDNSFVHLHVPEGATPKDGPSAGITMTTALISLLLKKAIKGVAMTGEITLTGQVFPVGGIREKLIAARRIGIKTLILPADNQGDVDALPEHIINGIQIHYARHYDDVFQQLFV